MCAEATVASKMYLEAILFDEASIALLDALAHVREINARLNETLRI